MSKWRQRRRSSLLEPNVLQLAVSLGFDLGGVLEHGDDTGNQHRHDGDQHPRPDQ